VALRAEKQKIAVLPLELEILCFRWFASVAVTKLMLAPDGKRRKLDSPLLQPLKTHGTVWQPSSVKVRLARMVFVMASTV
jgi:hypothetical protein